MRVFEKINKIAHVMNRHQKKVCVSYYSVDENENCPKNGSAKVSVSYESGRKNKIPTQHDLSSRSKTTQFA